MKQLIILALIVFGGYKAYQHYDNGGFTSGPSIGFVTIYGHDNCPVTTRTLKELRKANVEYDYRDITNKPIMDGLIADMKYQNLNTRVIDLPVLDIHGKLYVRPSIDGIVARL